MREEPNDPLTLPGTESADPRPDVGLPGADRPEPVPDPQPDPNDDLPERLGKRIERGPGAIAPGEPDLLPDIEVPEAQM